MMNQKSKNIFTKIYCPIVLLLAVAFVVAAFLPAVSVNTGDMDYEDAYKEGKFTQHIQKPDEVTIGFSTVLDIVLNFGDISTILDIQGLEAEVKDIQKTIKELESADTPETSKIQQYEKKLEKAEKELDEALAGLTKEDEDRITERLRDDETFIHAVVAYYSFTSAMESDTVETEFDTFKTGIMAPGMVSAIAGTVLLVAILVAGIVFTVVMIIKLLILLVRILKAFIKNDAEKMDAATKNFPFMGYTVTMLALTVMIELLGHNAFDMGIGVLVAAILFAVLVTLRAVKTVLFAQESKLSTIIKQALSVLSIVAVVLLVVGFVQVNLFNQFKEVIADITRDQYLAAILDGGNKNSATDAVATSNVINTSVLVVIAIFFISIIAGIAYDLYHRISGDLLKTKSGKLVPYNGMIVIAGFVLVLGLVPSFFAVDSAKARDEAFENGNFKIWYEEYRTEGTGAYVSYEMAKSMYESSEDQIEKLREELSSANGEKAEAIQMQLDGMISARNILKDALRSVEEPDTGRTLCMIGAIVFAVSEFAYFFLTIAFHSAKKKKEAEAKAAAEAEAEVEAEAAEAEAEAAEAEAVNEPEVQAVEA